MCERRLGWDDPQATRLLHPCLHFTRTIHGGVEAGPNAVLPMAQEGYGKANFSARESLGTLAYPGFWSIECGA
jgi:L-2-hydroxyglutarate oxidase LhgO